MYNLEFTFEELDEIRANLARTINAQKRAIKKLSGDGCDTSAGVKLLKEYLEGTEALYKKINNALKY